MKSIQVNKKLISNFEVKKEYTCGIILKGHQVKCLRNGDYNLYSGYVKMVDNLVFITNISICASSYDKLQLLLNQIEINQISELLKKGNFVSGYKGLYTKKGLFKIKVIFGKNLRKYEKREKIKERDFNRSLRREHKYI